MSDWEIVMGDANSTFHICTLYRIMSEPPGDGVWKEEHDWGEMGRKVVLEQSQIMWKWLRFTSIISIIAFGCTIAQQCAIDSHLLVFWGYDAFTEDGCSTALAVIPGVLLKKHCNRDGLFCPHLYRVLCELHASHLHHCVLLVTHLPHLWLWQERTVIRVPCFLAQKGDLKQCKNQGSTKKC